MSKLASKIPQAIKTVVSNEKDIAFVWYARPRNLGKLQYEGGYWFTLDRMRFMSSRDAMEYLIKMYEAQGHSPSAPESTVAVAAPARKSELVNRKAGTRVQDKAIREILAVLKKHPEVQALLDEQTETKVSSKESRANL